MAAESLLSMLRAPLDSKWAPRLPVFAGIIIVALVVITHIISVTSGHCDFIDVDGQVRRIAFPAISPSTRLSPERWIWTLGVTAVWILLLCPCIILVWRVLQAAEDGLCSVPGLCQLLLLTAGFGLLGEAIIPLQADVLDPHAEINLQSLTHLLSASIFFLSSFAHGVLVSGWQCGCCKLCCRANKVFGTTSLYMKLTIVCLVLATFVVPGPFLVMIYGVDALQDNLLLQNMGGLQQRLIVFFIILFIGSYGLDIADLQTRMAVGQLDGAPGLAGSISMDAATNFVGHPVAAPVQGPALIATPVVDQY